MEILGYKCRKWGGGGRGGGAGGGRGHGGVAGGGGGTDIIIIIINQQAINIKLSVTNGQFVDAVPRQVCADT